MVRVLLSGCSGRMGEMITSLAKEEQDIEIAAGVDVFTDVPRNYPVFADFSACDVPVDVIIDFSSPKAFDAMTAYAKEKKVPAVVCTTGLSDAQTAKLKELSEDVAFLRSANMSLGINTLQKVLREAARILSPAGFDIEIVEKHHNKKKDAPSGTALALAECVNEALEEKKDYVYDRSGRFEERRPSEIGISAVRGGNIVGEHEVIFAGTDEVITFKHTAYSRAVFGKGALAAARFLSAKTSGLYDMSDVIG